MLTIFYMRPGRELDITIAKFVFGHEVKTTKKLIVEKAASGDRPLRYYSRDMQFAWEVADKMNISLIPVENGEWFAMVGAENRWSGPADFIKYLQAGNFVDAGAAVGQDAALTICLAAVKALQHRQKVMAPAPDLSLQN